MPSGREVLNVNITTLSKLGIFLDLLSALVF